MRHVFGLMVAIILAVNVGAASAQDVATASMASAPQIASGPATPAFEAKPPFAEWFDQRRKQAAAAGLTPRGLVPEVPETGATGVWTIPVPEINPLGAQKLYTKGASYKKAGGLKLSFLDNGAEIQKSLSGEGWTLSFAIRQGDVLPFLTEYARKIGGEVLPGLSDDGFVFRVTKPDAVWWCDVSAEIRDRVDLRILRQPVLAINTEFKVTKGMFGSDGVFRCVATIPGRNFLLLECSLSNGGITLAANGDFNTRDGMTLIRFRKYPDFAEYPKYTYYDFPQDPGIYEITLEKRGNALPDEITLKLAETPHALPGYTSGGMGLLVVKDVPAGKVYATPQAFVDIRQGGCSLSGGVTKDFGAACGNDVTFRLPAGYYTVGCALNTEFADAKTQLVPVSAGERTTVRFPESCVAANAALSARGDDRQVTGEIIFNSKKDLGQTAEIAVSVSDPRERDIFPTRENTVITESGAKTEILDIRREVVPCSIALAIDSSGSMKRDMKATLEAAKTFLRSLPASSFVRVIDFDGTVRELKGGTASEAVKALSSIKAEGSTKLYDATVKGIELVKGKTRPAVVVFTDGVDSREDKKGAGSSSSREQVVKKIVEADVPVYTIGFGKRLNADETVTGVDGAPDIACLTEFAAISSGQYYPAKDPEALRSVFAAIGSKLGNNFVITYRRPVENNAGNTPVVSLVVDNSGSMNTDPKKPNAKEGDFRMEKTKRMLGEFVGKLPAAAVTQFTTFRGGGAKSIEVNRRQVSTTNRVNLMKAIGEMNADDGTPIVCALTSAYENLAPISSRRKVIVFLTDSGLEVPQNQQHEYKKILTKIREKGIFVLWIGMGISTPAKETVFADAAKATDGEYVISESTEDISKKLSALLERLEKPVESMVVPIAIEISYKTAQGETLRFKAQDQAEFTPPAKAGTPVEPDAVAVATGEKAPLNDAPTTRAVGGTTLEGVDYSICARTDIGRTMSNKAMDLTVRRAVYLDRLLGLDARRSGLQFAAFEIELRNRTEKNIPYIIPSILKHFYLGLDAKGLYPASKATWLAETPVTRHGNPSIEIPAGGTAAGTLIFLVPARSDGFAQQSLHFYDTEYGHIQMPIAGTLPDRWLELAKLPTARPADLSDTFKLTVTATSLEQKLDRYAAEDGARFRVIEGSFESRVLALLNIDPAQRILLRYPTATGDLMARLSDVTGFIPLGFRDPVMLAPSSGNVIRLAYEVPTALDIYQSELYFDLAKGSAVIPVSEGKKYGAPAPIAEIDGDLFKVRVNQLTQVPSGVTITDETGDPKIVLKGCVVLDATFIDKPGNEGTIIPQNYFALVSKSYKPDSKAVAGRIGLGGGGGAPRKDLLNTSRANDRLIFGIGNRFGVFEGQERRAIVIFDDPGKDLANWTLQSPFNDRLQVPISQSAFASPELIAYRANVTEKENPFARALDTAVDAAVQKYAALDRERRCTPVIRFEKDDGYDDLVIPPVNTYGLRAMSGITTEKQFLDLMATISCLPKNANWDKLTAFDASPESVVTQGFGDIGATANLAVGLLSRLGLSPRLEALEFTDTGAQALLEYHGIDVRKEKTAPAGISYDDGANGRKTFVIPFMRDIAELPGFVYRPRDAVKVSGSPSGHSAVILVTALYEPSSDGSVNAAAGDAGSALGGGGGKKTAELRMLNANLRLDTLSRDAVDLAFAPITAGKKSAYGVVLMTPDGVVTGDKPLENFQRVTAIRVEITGLDRPCIHTIDLDGERKPEQFLITLGINLPDLPAKASAALSEAFKAAFDGAKKPEPFTAARWHNRQVLYRLIAGQTAFDTELVPPGGMVLGRIRKPRCIAVVSERDGGGQVSTSIDLLQPFNEIHAGNEDLRRAYFLLNGFFQSSLESRILPETTRMGYLDVWRNAPKDAEILAIAVGSERSGLLKRLEKTGTFPERLLKAVKENKKVLFFPSKPAIIAGKERFAWLEMDPVTFEMLSVFDNGLHGGTAEFSMLTTSLGEDTREFVKGTWIGINMSVWSVGSIALKTQEKGQIFTEAKALALKIGATLAEFQDNLGKAKEYYDKIGELQEKSAEILENMGSGGGDDGGDSDDTDYGAKIKENLTKVFDQLPRVKIFGVDANAKLKDGFRGFTNGYNTAVDVYFHAFSGTKKHVEVGKGGGS